MPGEVDEKYLTDKQAYTHWAGEVEDALSREKKYRETAKKVVDLYESKDEDLSPFAILYSNTETLVPAVYNARPIPVVSRRFKDADPIGKSVSEVSTRLLKYLIDCNSENYDTFDELMAGDVLSGALVNRGISRFKYSPPKNNGHESVVGENVRWDKIIHGYARTWKKLPWLGFEWDMSKEEIRENFKGAKIDFRKFAASEGTDTDDKSDDKIGVTTYKVYEIWDKASRTVVFMSPCYQDGLLRRVKDPLGLTGFFPCPKPLNFTRKVTTLTPTPLYEYYRSQAAELNEITRRLKHIVSAIKYRGFYNSTIENIEKVLTAEDNTLIPVENVEAIGENAKLDNHIWIVPVQELAQTAQQLYQQREGIKQVIYEITGISDILRGASVASETATAQNIKNQWGTLRLKKMQKEVQRYCRDSLEIVLEIASAKFETDTIKSMTGLPFLRNSEKQQILQQKQQMEATAQQMAQQPQMPGQPPQQPPQMPEIPQEVQMLLTLPTWEEIEKVLRDNIIRQYKTDIETNSTLDAEASQDKQDITELLNALSQFLNGIAPLVEKGMMPLGIAKSIMLTISRRYNFGSQIEEELNSMGEPPPNPADGQEAEVAQMEAQAKIQEIQMKMQMAKLQHEQKMKEMAAEAQLNELELSIKREELALKQKDLSMKTQAAAINHKLKIEQMEARAKERSSSNASSETTATS